MRALFLLVLLPLLATAQTAEPPAAAQLRQRIEQAVQTRQYSQITTMAEAWHRKAQMADMGMAEPQYIAELLDLHRLGNSLDRDDKGLDWKDLRRLRGVELQPPLIKGQTLIYEGTALLKGGQRLKVKIEMVPCATGYCLTGAVG